MSESQKRLLSVLQGNAVWPPPVWLMRQAGRYLPEFRALREKADFITRCMTPDIATEITLQPIRRYAMDGAILFSDILILPWAMGQGLQFIEGTGPVLPPIRTRSDLEKLDPKRVGETIEPILETIKRLRSTLDAPGMIGHAKGGQTTLIGFAGAPFTVACYMVEGGGAREFPVTRSLAYADPMLFDRLIDMLTQSTADMLCAQIEAGAEAVMLFDSWAGLLPPEQFRRYVIEPAKQIVAHIRNRYPEFPVIGFPRLGGVLVGEYARASGVNVVALDTSMDMRSAASLVPDHVGLQGNLDPLVLVQGGEAMRNQAIAIRDELRGVPHIFNLGHGVVPQTPPEHVEDLINTIRTHGVK